jgi:Mu-like prophage I protein
MATWSAADVDSLPDSSFGFVSGDTRKLPYKDKDGNVDLPHVRDALSRLDQTQGIPESEKAAIKAKLEKVLSEQDDKQDKLDYSQGNSLPNDMLSPVISPFKLDANGELPTRFPIFVTGDWPHSIKGNFKVALDNLKRMKEKFDAGIGFPTKDASTGLAVNFGHDVGGPAGAWVKGIELEANEATSTGTLFATQVEYTDEGEKAIRSGRYKCISPEGAFGFKNGQLSALPSHLNLKEKLTDVLTGFGFTNMPYLSEMAPVMCSATADDGPMIFVKEENKENDTMNLDALRVKENKDVTSEERQFLSANKDKLSADELKRFELTNDDTVSKEDRELLAAVKSGSKKVVDDNDGDEDVSAEDRQTLADIKSGKKKLVDAGEKLDALTQDDRDMLTAIQSGKKKVVDADLLSKLDKLDKLEAVAEEFEHNKAEQIVQSHIQRGAIKPDQKDSTTSMLLSAEGDARKVFEDHLSALPSNELLAGEVGHDKDVNVDVNDELKQKTMEVQSKAKAGGETLSYAQAQDRLMRDDADIKQRYEASKVAK